MIRRRRTKADEALAEAASRSSHLAQVESTSNMIEY